MKHLVYNNFVIKLYLIVLTGEKEKTETSEPPEDFPLSKLATLDEQLGRPKWVVPVRPGDELEMLLRAAIKLAKEGITYNFICIIKFFLGRDQEFEQCQRFYKEGLTTSFVRILTDDAVNTWKADIQV